MKNATNKFIIIYLGLVVLMLIFAAKCSGQYRKPTDSVLYKFTVPSYTTYRYLPVYRDTIIIRDTVVIRDTVFVATNPPQELIWSKFKGTFQQFVDSAAKAGLVAYIDKSVTPAATVQIPSNITIESDTNATISNIHKTLFQLSKATGRQIFKGLRIIQDSIGTAFSRITFSASFYDSLHNIQVQGGLGAYESSRGGTESQMAVTAMRNCEFDNSYINISVFSQDGPYRALHLYNVQLKAKTSHNIYVHPATSLWYDSVACISAGKLMQHQYSGSLNGGYKTGKYSVFNRVYSGKAPFEMTSLANESPVIITNSSLAPYVTANIPPALVHATNSHFFNAGNGIFLRGVLDSCTGGVWSAWGYELAVKNSNLKEFSFRGGGISAFDNTTISNVWGADRGNPFDMQFRNCTIGQIWDGGNGAGT
ncbi:MAG: hypothetical protein ACRCR4_00310, partial [Thiotrichaceae bacterium]